MKKYFITIYTKLIKTVIKLFLVPFSKTQKAKLLSGWLVNFIPKIFIDIPESNDKIVFFCPSNTAIYRAESLFTKEPETIDWIKSFDQNDYFWDIGANVGVFSLFAASRKINTYAFEPSAGNYWILNNNIYLNKFDHLIKALPIAFSNKTEFGVFNMGDLDLGGAIYSFGNEKQSINVGELEKKVFFHQGMIGISIDEFIAQYKITEPNHIKIDVDGIESNIIDGAKDTLLSETTKSVMIELDSSNKDDVNYIMQIMDQSRLKFLGKKHEKKHVPDKFDSIYNYFFSRN